MKILWAFLLLLAMLFVSTCGEVTRETGDLSSQRMTDGTVLDVTPAGDVRIGAKASLIVTANDGMVYVKGPFAVGDDLIVEDGKVRIKNLENAGAHLERIQELEDRIASLEQRLAALESGQLAASQP